MPRHYGECFVMNARKDALAADVVVVNHHLFFADVMLQGRRASPSCCRRANTVILDEAHQLPDTATLFFGEEVTAGQLGRARARRRSRGAEAPLATMPPLPDAAQALALALRRFRLAAGEAPGKLPRPLAMRARGFDDALDALARGAGDASQPSSRVQAERSDDLAQCAQRAARCAGAARTVARSTGRSTRVDPLARRHARRAGNCMRRRYRSPKYSPRQVTDMRARLDLHRRRHSAIGGDFALYQRELGSATPRPATGRARSTTARQALLVSAARICPSRTASSTPMRSSRPRCRC